MATAQMLVSLFVINMDKFCGQNGLDRIRGSFRKEALTKVKTLKQQCTVSSMKKSSKYWLKYKLPKRLVRNEGNCNQPVCIGQKQRWFLLQLTADESTINLKATKNPEFDGWRWVSFWYPVRQVVSFKRDVYRKVMKEFAFVLFNENRKTDLERNRKLERKEIVQVERYEPKSEGYKKDVRRPYRAWQSNKGRAS